MTKKQTKKQNQKNIKSNTNKNNSRLGPGKKKCKNCPKILAIHTKKCTQCGHIHQMKKSKQEVMKNLNKITPIIIKSILENNQFNSFHGWKYSNHIYDTGQIQKLSNKQLEIPVMAKRKSSTSKKKSNSLFKQTNLQGFQILSNPNPITCISAVKNYLIFVQSIKKVTKQHTYNQNTTIKAYGLQHYHCLGINYEGESLIKILHNQLPYQQISIDRHIVSIKIFSNLIATLTGQSTIIIFTFHPQKQSQGITKKKLSQPQMHQYQLKKMLQIRESLPDRITSYEWLRGSATEHSILIVVGTLYGHLSVYEIQFKKNNIMQQNRNEQDYYLLRYIPKAHLEFITCISQSPLNTQNSILFASGCYDGSIKIWDLQQIAPVIECDVTNRKIQKIYWDPGAKFLLVLKDQLNDNLILLCFYSINKIEESVSLSNSVEMRIIKKHFPVDHQNCKIIINEQSYDSKVVGFLDAVNGYFKVVSVQELRGTSLKKKKSRESREQGQIFQIIMKKSGQFSEIKKLEKSQDVDEDEKKSINQQKTEIQKKFPIYCGMTVTNIICKGKKEKNVQSHIFYLATYNGTIIRYQN